MLAVPPTRSTGAVGAVIRTRRQAAHDRAAREAGRDRTVARRIAVGRHLAGVLDRQAGAAAAERVDRQRSEPIPTADAVGTVRVNRAACPNHSSNAA